MKDKIRKIICKHCEHWIDDTCLLNDDHPCQWNKYLAEDICTEIKDS